MASSRSTQWLIGCGVGCAVLVVLVILAGAGGVAWIRSTLVGFEQAEQSHAALEEALGEAADYVPPPDGAIAPERMEIFLTVRDETGDARRGVEAFFDSIPLTEEAARELEREGVLKKIGAALRITRAAVGFAGDLGELYAARNAALARLGMGPGEYLYIYLLAYQSFLGHPPDDGPGGESREEVEVDLGRDMRRTRGRVRDDLVAILGNQVEAIDAAGRADLAELRSALLAEIEALERNRWRVPFAEDLPRSVRDSLEPYRERLEASYSAAASPFELGEPQRRGGLSVQVE
ncbi:MAG: hypothetical protein R3325_04580 [Thermoanaerobaculia bacterium]|nr:hypothetical protein [Thermoanaerobaculia bacterium]